jgi:spore coat polysaccharide biosynthesis protein SpsF
VPSGLPAEVAELRLTVDTPEDFELMRLIYEDLYLTKPDFGLPDILDLFRHRPDLPLINRGIKQKPVHIGEDTN